MEIRNALFFALTFACLFSLADVRQESLGEFAVLMPPGEVGQIPSWNKAEQKWEWVSPECLLRAEGVRIEGNTFYSQVSVDPNSCCLR